VSPWPSPNQPSLGAIPLGSGALLIDACIDIGNTASAVEFKTLCSSMLCRRGVLSQKLLKGRKIGAAVHLINIATMQMWC
jgi:hypothetical protein